MLPVHGEAEAVHVERQAYVCTGNSKLGDDCLGHAVFSMLPDSRVEPPSWRSAWTNYALTHMTMKGHLSDARTERNSKIAMKAIEFETKKRQP